MCNDHPDEIARRALSIAGLLESCARLFRASLRCDADHVDGATNATHGLAYDLEHDRPMSVYGAAAVPDEVVGVALLAALPEGYALAHPVRLVVHRSELILWVTSETCFLHGTGHTRAEAIEDYACALVDYLELLREDRAILAPHLRDHLKQLEQFILNINDSED